MCFIIYDHLTVGQHATSQWVL